MIYVDISAAVHSRAGLGRYSQHLAAALLGQKVQASLDSDEMSEAEEAMIEKHPKRLKSEGKKSSRRPYVIRM